MKKRTLSEEAECDVLAAIGRWALEHVVMHRGELADQMFKDVVREFDGRYPQHKMLTELWQAAREPKAVGDASAEPPRLLHRGECGPEQAD